MKDSTQKTPPHPLKEIFKTDLGKAKKSIENWLAERHQTSEDISISSIETLGGLSHELINFSYSWKENGQKKDRDLIIRLDPVNYRKRKTSNLRREFELLSIMSDSTSVPVAKPYWYEADSSLLGAEFYAMSKIGGVAPRDEPPFQTYGWIAELAADKRETLWKNSVAVMAQVHKEPVAQFSVLRRDQSNQNDLMQHIEYWRENYDWGMGGEKNEVAETAWRWLRNNIPQNHQPGVAWGDARYSNIMFDKNSLEVLGVVDWEDVSLGGPLFDLGRWFLAETLHSAVGLPHPEGFGYEKDTIKLWEVHTGFSAADILWYKIFHAACAVALVTRTGHLQAEILGKRAGPASHSLAVFEGMLNDWLAEA